MAETITFGTLHQVLLGLGFVATEVPGSHIAYEHSPSGTALVLRLQGPKEVADAASLAVTRRTLIEKGILDRARLEDLFRKRAMAG